MMKKKIEIIMISKKTTSKAMLAIRIRTMISIMKEMRMKSIVIIIIRISLTLIFTKKEGMARIRISLKAIMMIKMMIT